MNLPVNRSSESPQSSENTPPELSSGTTQPPLTQSTQSEAIDPLTMESADEMKRQQPIPPPSHPRQYRAIGLVYGQYQQSEDQLTRGMIQTPDGSAIDAVILGRVISLVKNHLDLEKPHLWVVYPRTRQENDDLHVQIVGVWEPETLDQEPSEKEKDEDQLSAISTSAEPGYFSIRGEVIFSDHHKQTVIIKIRQSPKKEIDKPKFFKLKLFGTLPSKPVSRFWDLQVSLRGDTLIIQEGLDLGFATKKKPFRQGGGYSKPFDRRRTSEYDSRSSYQGQEGEKRRPIPKPSFNKGNQPLES